VSGDKVYQDEDTPFAPNSPYAAAKMAAHNLVHVYRESYGLHACCGILFNHESERRGENFVTRKITKWVAGLKECLNRKTVIALESHDKDTLYYSSKLGGSWHFPKLRLGNIDAYRDWGHAEDYVRAMHLMTQKKEPKDYVISTGKTHRVRDFLQEALACIGVDNYEDYFVVDPQFYRPCEVEYLCGDSSKAQRELDWKPEISFKQLVQRMVESDINVS
jgi:GDPmannose 4,6-dehydratase